MVSIIASCILLICTEILAVGSIVINIFDKKIEFRAKRFAQNNKKEN